MEWKPKQVNQSILKAFTLDSFIYKYVNSILQLNNETWPEIKKWFPLIALFLNEFHFTNKKLDLTPYNTLYRASYLPQSVV